MAVISTTPDPSARTQPPHIRSQLAGLEREQKTRATRHSRDVLDRSLVDLSVLEVRIVVDLHDEYARPRPNSTHTPPSRIGSAAVTTAGSEASPRLST